MKFDTIKMEVNDRIATLRFSRPDVMNAFNEQQVFDLAEATAYLRDSHDIRVVILTGEGKGFTSGADLSEKGAGWDDTKDALMRGYLPSFKNLIEMPKITIASINGPAAGIGAAFALACDFKVMSEDAFILSVFSNIALVPDGGLNWLLARSIGYNKALEYAIEAKKIKAEECYKLGIANKICPSKDLEKVTLDWANVIANRSPQAVSNTKKLMRDSFKKTYYETYEDEAEIQNTIFGNEEFQEGVSAFFQKREPKFK
tara:strand:+ start:26728 stop:27501 length:774 start_codon:yes stop_codon:yes gene_type:complete